MLLERCALPLNKESNTSFIRNMHKLLIHAAVDNGRKSVDSFEAWKKRIYLTDIDYQSQRVLPSIVDLLSSDELSSQIRKLTRFTWLRSQVLLQAGFRAEEAIRTRNIPVTWIKGCAILARTSTTVVKRTMDDIALLVPKKFSADALQALKEAGFSSLGTVKKERRLRLFDHQPSFQTLYDSTGAGVELHWRPLGGSSKLSSDEAIWERVTSVEILKLRTSAISPEDLFLQVVTKKHEGNGANWVIDAVWVMENNKLDWTTLRRLAREQKVLIKFHLGLTRLAYYKPVLLPTPNRLLAPLLDLIDSALSALRRFF